MILCEMLTNYLQNPHKQRCQHLHFSEVKEPIPRPFSARCCVRKHVQRFEEDTTVLIITYFGLRLKLFLRFALVCLTTEGAADWFLVLGWVIPGGLGFYLLVIRAKTGPDSTVDDGRCDHDDVGVKAAAFLSVVEDEDYDVGSVERLSSAPEWWETPEELAHLPLTDECLEKYIRMLSQVFHVPRFPVHEESENNRSSSSRPICQIAARARHTTIDCYNRLNLAYEGRVPSKRLSAMAASTTTPASYGCLTPVQIHMLLLIWGICNIPNHMMVMIKSMA